MIVSNGEKLNQRRRERRFGFVGRICWKIFKVEYVGKYSKQNMLESI